MLASRSNKNTQDISIEYATDGVDVTRSVQGEIAIAPLLDDRFDNCHTFLSNRSICIMVGTAAFLLVSSFLEEAPPLQVIGAELEAGD